MKKTLIYTLISLSLAATGAIVGDIWANYRAAAATAGTCYYEATATSDGKTKFGPCSDAKVSGVTFDPAKCYIISSGSTTTQATEADCKTLGTTTSTPSGGTSTGVKCEDANSPGDCTSKTAFSFDSCGTDNVGIRCLVVEVLKFLNIGVGLAVVGGIAAGGIMYATAEGNASKTQTGIKIIANAILGLVLYLLMFAILQFLIPGGVIS